MAKADTLRREDSGLRYFATTALFLACIALIVVYTLISSSSGGTIPPDPNSTVHLWYLCGIAAFTSVMSIAYFGNLSRRGSHPKRARSLIERSLAPLVFGAAVMLYVWAAALIMIDAHRRYVVVIAIFQAAVALIWMKAPRSPWLTTATFVVATLAWAVTAGLTYTPLADWLLAASPTTGLAPLSFAATILAVTIEIMKPQPFRLPAARSAPRHEIMIGIALIALFLECGLRTDHLLSDWIPYHRSYFVNAATFIRAGHWLLWDIPSQYGFFSELAIAITPGHNAWQSLYILSALVLTLEAIMIYVVGRFGRSGWLNVVVVASIAIACLFGSEATHFPFGARLYPQQGLRFLWTMAVVFALFLNYVNRDDQRKARLCIIGAWAAWAASILWSFETCAWTTVIWFGYLSVDAMVGICLARKRRRFALSLLLTKLLPVILVPTALVQAVDWYYRYRLGHGPDWTSYLEFSAAYTGNDVIPAVSYVWGAGLLCVLLLGAFLLYTVEVTDCKRWRALPLVAVCFITLWTAVSYYVIEPFDQHVNMLLELIVLSVFILLAVEREEKLSSFSLQLARLSMVPMLALPAAMMFGEPGHWHEIKAPGIVGFHIDPSDDFPGLPTELAALTQQAGITVNDLVIFPNSPDWPKLESGLIMPFVRLPDGHMHEILSWLPLSPVGAANTFFTLPLDRRQLYTERYLRMSGWRTGWLIVRHEHAECSQLSPNLRDARRIESRNYSAALCVKTH